MPEKLSENYFYTIKTLRKIKNKNNHNNNKRRKKKKTTSYCALLWMQHHNINCLFFFSFSVTLSLFLSKFVLNHDM